MVLKKVVIYINPHKYAVEHHYNYDQTYGRSVGRRIKPSANQNPQNPGPP